MSHQSEAAVHFLVLTELKPTSQTHFHHPTSESPPPASHNQRRERGECVQQPEASHKNSARCFTCDQLEKSLKPPLCSCCSSVVSAPNTKSFAKTLVDSVAHLLVPAQVFVWRRLNPSPNTCPSAALQPRRHNPVQLRLFFCCFSKYSFYLSLSSFTSIYWI